MAVSLVLCIFLCFLIIPVSSESDNISLETSNVSDSANDTVAINVVEGQNLSEAEGDSESEEEESMNICEIPSLLDRFLYLFVFTNQCYAYSGSGPEWSAMTGWPLGENESDFSSARRIWINRKQANSVSHYQETAKTIYSCGNGKKLPPFLPMVHILNASWFLQASTSTKNEEKEKASEKASMDEGKNNTGGGVNETVSRGTTQTKDDQQRNQSNPDEDWCMLVNFYSPRCPFSAKLAPFYNALPRVFPKLLYIAAVDATESSRVNLIYGVAGTPTVMLFQNGKPVARLDEGEFALQRLTYFISQRTDLKPIFNVDVESEDLYGPLPSVPVRGMDYYLLLAWAFIIACAMYYGARSSSAQRIWEALCRNWREMEEERGNQAADG